MRKPVSLVSISVNSGLSYAFMQPLVSERAVTATRMGAVRPRVLLHRAPTGEARIRWVSLRTSGPKITTAASNVAKPVASCTVSFNAWKARIS